MVEDRVCIYSFVSDNRVSGSTKQCLPVHLKGSVQKGDKRFNSPKSSKVKKVFSLLNKA